MLLRETVPARVASDHVDADMIYELFLGTSIRGAAAVPRNVDVDLDLDLDLDLDVVADAVVVMDVESRGGVSYQDHDRDYGYV